MENGGLFIACNQERLKEYRRLAELGQFYGIESRILSPCEIQDVHPLIAVDDVCGALYSPSDGTIDPTGIVNAYSRAAKERGGIIREGVGVAGFEHDENGRINAVITECGAKIQTNAVVNAAGAWAADVALMAGVHPLPLVAMKHAFVVTEAIEGMHPGLPNVRDHDLSIYLKTQVC